MGLLVATFGSGVASGASLASTSAAPDPPLLMPLDSIIVVVFLVATFRSGVGVAAFLASAYAAPDPPPTGSLDSVIAVVFLVAAFEFSWGAAAFLASACASSGPPLSKLRTYLTAALLGVCCSSDVGFVTNLPS
jgi:hypothetical protein